MRTNQAPVPRASELVFCLHGESRQINWRLTVDEPSLEETDKFWRDRSTAISPRGKSARKLRGIHSPVLIAIGERITQLMKTNLKSAAKAAEWVLLRHRNVLG
jgi:hypothetical protein